MWTLFIALTASSAPVKLRVAVPHEAGTTDDIRTSGDILACAREAAEIHCSATGPVTFEWTGNQAYTLGPPVRVEAGAQATAWVLAAPGSREDLEALLLALAATPEATPNDIDALRRATVFTSDWTPQWPTRVALDALIALLRHPDIIVRREALEALHPWIGGTRFDPLPVQAPIPLTSTDLVRVSKDPDHGVRRRVARALRTARPAVDSAIAKSILDDLLHDSHPGVRRATVVALPDAVDLGFFTATEAWDRVVAMLAQPRPAGRAACNQLTRLRSRIGDDIADEAVEGAFISVLRHHPERAWTVWVAYKDRLPTKEAWIRRLVVHTVGLEPPLVKHWAASNPEALRKVLDNWSPTTFPERKAMLERWAAQSK